MKAAAALLALAIAGCATVQPRQPDRGWTLQASATAGAALAWPGADGRELLRIACRRSPTDLYVASDAAGPGRAAVNLRIGDRSFPLPPAGDEPRLAAAGPVPSALSAAMMSARSIGVTHAGGTLGPFPAPDAKTAAAFLISCRG